MDPRFQYRASSVKSTATDPHLRDNASSHDAVNAILRFTRHRPMLWPSISFLRVVWYYAINIYCAMSMQCAKTDCKRRLVCDTSSQWLIFGIVHITTAYIIMVNAWKYMKRIVFPQRKCDVTAVSDGRIRGGACPYPATVKLAIKMKDVTRPEHILTARTFLCLCETHATYVRLASLQSASQSSHTTPTGIDWLGTYDA